MVATYLAGLNTAQLQAVEHPAHVPLQILAGPGSGKTRVLTCRIVHLILHHGMQPSSLCAVTFTNKAAGEMRTRITKLIGQGKTDQIKMGTFHALCAKFIRRHAGKAGVRGNFTICDADESKKILKKSLKRYAEELGTIEMVPDVNFMVGKISKAKAQGLSPRDLIRDINPESLHPKDIVTRIVSKIYEEYQRTLAQNNSLDFDDLLVKGVHLFRDYPEVAAWCKHILVDEFQDTNTIQYQLMKYIAAANNCVTIVGDPDQSIYGWRSAEVENIRRMKHDFPSVACVLLEQNYRSTGAILAASVAIVAEDKDRLPKTLFTTHPTGPLPLLHQFENGRDEGQFIALEVKRIIAYTGGMLNHNDFAILLRYNSLSRTIERELQKERIPHKVLGGRKFFERMEIKDLLAYLQLVDNPEYVPAFVRIINVPPRSIGAKTVEQILAKAKQMKISPMEVVIRIHEGKIPDTKPPLKRKVTDFVDAIRLLRERAEQHCSTSILIPKLIQSIDYEEYLKKYDKDFEERWMNVEELMNFAAETETQPAHNVHMGLPPVGDDPMDDTPLRTFLQTSMLSTDSDAAEDDKTPKITIATCHAAKGLEWPVVFVPSVESGVFPAARAEDIEEERRLLYVACTRAQNYLSITHAQSR
ncbi:UvrD-helicase-domain-containing protein, partial [Cristinia sonorae]